MYLTLNQHQPDKYQTNIPRLMRAAEVFSSVPASMRAGEESTADFFLPGSSKRDVLPEKMHKCQQVEQGHANKQGHP